jgi:hypothetical protein
MENQPKLNVYKLNKRIEGVVVIKAQTRTRAFKLLQEFEGNDPYLVWGKTEEDLVLVPEVEDVIAYYAP